MPLPRSVVVLIDSREKKPLPLPKHLVTWDRSSPPGKPRKVTIQVRQEVRTLETADYVLGGAPGAVGIERKANLDELRQNLCTRVGERRFLKACARLRDNFERPVLLLEGSPLALMRGVRGPHTDPAVVRDLLMDTCARYGISLFTIPTGTIPQRRAAGEWLVALLLSGVTHGGRTAQEPDLAGA